MRGKASFSFVFLPTCRFTPAYAGKSKYEESLDSTKRVHPRVCGEKYFRIPQLYSLLGSPPRMRGKVTAASFRCDFKGFTPAYAGKSGNTGDASDVIGVHPRVCGEKVIVR